MNGRAEALLDDLGVPDGHPLRPLLLGQLRGSRPLAAFLAAHAAKVRRKLRVPDPEALADVGAELAVAAWLLRERRWTLTFEPLAASGGRSPDFRVAALDGSGAWFVEVTRLRDPAAHLPLRLARVLAGKAGQGPPGAVTVLAVLLPVAEPGAPLLAEALGLLARASQASEGGPAGVDGRRFARERARLSGVLLSSVQSGEFAGQLYPLSGARHPVPDGVARRLRALG
ncbi:hypothetical protein [Deinococcus radiotolerans]|uniref:hypothetical protein n=1 Tax=Deinococcus radiotolerans TaxID=1309407 RepID=UPI001667948C|nr:hypothetical protein [Deinococcus radiotolerans]